MMQSSCLFVSSFAQKNFQTNLHETFREGWQWASELMVKFWWRSVSYRYTDCFSDSSKMGDICIYRH